jgi:hypothetical protein
LASVTLVGYDALHARLERVGHVDARLMKMLGLQVIREATLRAPQKTRNLVHSLQYEPIGETSGRVTARADYAAYVEFGTGLYGPKHEKITPKAKMAMRWMGGAASAFRLTGSVRSGAAGAGAGYIFATSTKGMHPHPYLIPGARAAIRSGGLEKEVDLAWEGEA